MARIVADVPDCACAAGQGEEAVRMKRDEKNLFTQRD